MGAAFLIMLREGLEMALIVAIVLAYLRKLDRRDGFRPVWAGTIAAGVLSAIAGTIVFAAVGELHGTSEQIVEGVTAFAAAGLLTWMIFWMRRQARAIKGELHAKIDRAVETGTAAALAAIAFFAILREGLETALFLLGSSAGHERGIDRFAGGVVGLAIAVGAGFLIYSGSKRINLRTFFTVTGVLVVFFAAGLVARGLHEFQEAGIIGSLNEHMWTIGSAWLDPDRARLGEFLEGLLGWNPSPSIEMVLVYFAYLIPIGLGFLAGTRGVPPVQSAADAQPVGAGAH